MKKLWLGAGIVLALAAAGYLFINWGRCLAGGGGVTYAPPEFITAGAPAALTLRLSNWGDNACIKKTYWRDGKPRALFTQVRCHVRLQGAEHYEAQSMRLGNESMSDASYAADYICDLPPQPKTAAGRALDYYFDYHWAEDYRRLDQKPLMVR